MPTYLGNLLPRLQQYSQTLNRRELFIDHPWVHIDEQGNKQQYIFERDGNLIMSLNGIVKHGRWRFIPADNSLLIDRTPTDSILLNHSFLNAGICVLQKDGFINEPWIMVNKNVVPDLNVERYLRSLLPENRNLRQLPVEGSYLLYRRNRDGDSLIGKEVLTEDHGVVNGIFKSSTDNAYYEISSGRITRLFKREKLHTDRGTIGIERDINTFQIANVGDRVYHNDGWSAYGEYHIKDKYSIIRMIKVHDGKIVKVKKNTLWNRFILFLTG